MSNLPIFRNTDIFSEPVKLLIKESYAIFSTIPRNDSDLNKANVIAISRRYRSIIHECVENLSRDITRDHAAQIRTFKELEVIWNLCEILLIDVAQAGTLIIQLRNWIKMHLDEMSPDAKELLESLDSKNTFLSEDNITDTYWDLLVKLVLQGETKKAMQMINGHPDFRRSNQMQMVSSMLENMPLSNQYIVSEFNNRWNNWSAWCKRELDTGQFKNNQHLLNIVRLLSQDKSVYADLAPKCETWYQLMVSYLVYSDPCMQASDPSELSRQMIATFKKHHPSRKQTDCDFFDEIIISAFEYDLLAVIANCCAYLDDNWWFVTHFVDLLHCCNQLQMHEIADCNKLHESFLQDYATTLFDDELLWPVGVSYLDKCAQTGTHVLEIQLSRIPLSIDDEVRANKIISIAKKRGLSHVPKSVCLLMARGWLSETTRLGNESSKLLDKPHRRPSTDTKGLPHAINLSNALYWAVKSGDPSIVTHISNQFLHYYCKTGTFPDNSVFENLRRSPLDNERLAFLTKYHEFRQLMEEDDDDLRDAGNLLRALLASKVFPKFFCHELLDDARNLLELRPVLVFQPNHTIDLMRSIEEITKEDKFEEDTDLRKNLVKNMARALITPIGSES